MKIGDTSTCVQDSLPEFIRDRAATPTPTVTRERIEAAFRAGWKAFMQRPKDMGHPGGCSSEKYEQSELLKCLADALGAVPEPPKPTVDLESAPYIGPMDPDEPTPRPWNNQDDGSITHPAFCDKQFGECRAMNNVDYELAMECVNEKAKPPKPTVSREAILTVLRETPVADIYGDWLGRVATELAARLAEPKGD